MLENYENFTILKRLTKKSKFYIWHNFDVLLILHMKTFNLLKSLKNILKNSYGFPFFVKIGYKV